MPNERWQSDFTHYRLADEEGTDVEILTFLDDHSRLVLDMTAHTRDRCDRRRRLPQSRESP